jgi:hypothetical protein
MRSPHAVTLLLLASLLVTLLHTGNGIVSVDAATLVPRMLTKGGTVGTYESVRMFVCVFCCFHIAHVTIFSLLSHRFSHRFSNNFLLLDIGALTPGAALGKNAKKYTSSVTWKFSNAFGMRVKFGKHSFTRFWSCT